MKKIIFILLIVLLLTGCSNSININFDDKINTTINLNFSLADYKKYNEDNKNYTDNELKSQIEAIRDNREALSTGNDDLYDEITYEANGNNYSAIYEYNYTYNNFKYNTALNSCFEYFLVKEDDDAIYISLSGKSICSPFQLNVFAPDRMINNNANHNNGSTYTWYVNNNYNDIYLSISKKKVTKSSSTIYLLYFGIIILFAIGAYFIKKKLIKN